MSLSESIFLKASLNEIGSDEKSGNLFINKEYCIRLYDFRNSK